MPLLRRADPRDGRGAAAARARRARRAAQPHARAGHPEAPRGPAAPKAKKKEVINLAALHLALDKVEDVKAKGLAFFSSKEQNAKRVSETIVTLDTQKSSDREKLARDLIFAYDLDCTHHCGADIGLGAGTPVAAPAPVGGGAGEGESEGKRKHAGRRRRRRPFASERLRRRAASAVLHLPAALVQERALRGHVQRVP